MSDRDCNAQRSADDRPPLPPSEIDDVPAFGCAMPRAHTPITTGITYPRSSFHSAAILLPETTRQSGALPVADGLSPDAAQYSAIPPLSRLGKRVRDDGSYDAMGNGDWGTDFSPQFSMQDRSASAARPPALFIPPQPAYGPPRHSISSPWYAYPPVPRYHAGAPSPAHYPTAMMPLPPTRWDVPPHAYPPPAPPTYVVSHHPSYGMQQYSVPSLYYPLPPPQWMPPPDGSPSSAALPLQASMSMYPPAPPPAATPHPPRPHVGYNPHPSMYRHGQQLAPTSQTSSGTDAGTSPVTAAPAPSHQSPHPFYYPPPSPILQEHALSVPTSIFHPPRDGEVLSAHLLADPVAQAATSEPVAAAAKKTHPKSVYTCRKCGQIKKGHDCPKKDMWY